MLKDYNKYKILKIFLFNPNDSFRLREISKITEISPKSVMNYLKYFEDEKIIKRYEKRDIPFYKAINDTDKLREFTRIAILYELGESGVINYLWDKLAPEAIVLYGGFSRGEISEESDIDLFAYGVDITKHQIELDKFEKIIGKRIHLMGEKSLKGVSEEFKNNLSNGIILKGYLKII
jgi:predicted nucleotidyltransferase/DNA-binding HxlR family transcriptional regulator